MSALDEFYDFSAAKHRGTAFLFSPWPTPDLRPHGWTLLGHEPLMLRTAGGDVPPPPPGLRIELVRDEASLRAFEIAMVRGFEAADLEAEGPGTVVNFVARVRPPFVSSTRNTRAEPSPGISSRMRKRS